MVTNESPSPPYEAPLRRRCTGRFRLYQVYRRCLPQCPYPGGLAVFPARKPLDRAMQNGRGCDTRRFGPLSRVFDFVSKLQLPWCPLPSIRRRSVKAVGLGKGTEVLCRSWCQHQPVDGLSSRSLTDQCSRRFAFAWVRSRKPQWRWRQYSGWRCKVRTRRPTGVHLDALGCRCTGSEVHQKSLTGALRAGLHHDEVVRNGRATDLVIQRHRSYRFQRRPG